ncbi:MAG: hypothetical protein C0425_01955 [Chlorobiaceae bacterium]|nr:hypothetical protein [Chlorobiaceae bacterium]MBA4309082.1 hypothetical protein [Chlorobiaceae bacterium]
MSYKTDCKIIYLQDKNGNDPYNLKKFNTATLVGKSDELFTKISESLYSQIDFDLREKHYNYFIRTNEEYEKSFINELKNIASQ